MLSLLVFLVVIGGAFAIIPLIDLPGNLAQIARIVLGIFFVIWLLNLIFQFAPNFPRFN